MAEKVLRIYLRPLCCLIALVVLCSSIASAQAPQPTGPTSTLVRTASKPVFPDEFSDLDEASSASAGKWTDDVVSRLERARQFYLKALALLDGKDTAAAASQFELSIALLNELATFPRIEENADFTDLAQSIIEDYESYIQSIDNLGENSSVFILRQRLFEEVEAARTKVEPILIPAPEEPANHPETIIPLPFNEPVQKNIAFLTTGKGRAFMKRCLERSGRWFDMLKRVAKEEAMPEEIVYLAMIESALNPNAVSWAKAVGMWQFIQPTGEQYELDVTFWKDERRDPEKATRAAMNFLKDLYNELGDWHLALAAYNCGAGGVRRSMRKAGVEKGTFWDIREKLPRETRHYVPLYVATAIVSMNREQYGFPDDSLQFHPPYQYETFTVAEPVNLAALATCVGIPTDSLRALNPELLRTCTPPNVRYELKVPRGSNNQMAVRFAALTDEQKRPWMNHTVTRGETLASIARRYHVSAADVASVNGLKGYKAKVRRGSTLRIPVGGTSFTDVAAVSPVSTNSTPASTTTFSTSTSSTSPGRSTTSATSHGGVSTHVVVSGDNLYTVSQRYGVRLTDLRNWNNLPYDKENIRIGDTLIVARIDQASAPTTAASVERIRVSRNITHSVTSGESLASIASLYQSTPERISELNNLKKNTTLKAGRKLTIETSLSKSELATITRSAPSGKPLFHKVKSGESLGSISALYGVDEDDLRRWNSDVVQGTTVFAKTRLKVYGAQMASKGSAASSSAKKLPKTYKVRRGDTITEIADKFGVSVQTLRRKNPQLRTSDALRTGQKVRLQ
ncbi:MAG: LysM peptidoglycan-binding domain-containing protein [bacterium]|nr:LysM peptidoglycan-binding domain-containing protein [bacterium]